MDENSKKLPKYVWIILIAVIIVVLITILSIIFTKKIDDTNTSEEMDGYGKLLEKNGETYTYIFKGDKIKIYTGYSDMNNFYYDVTCVSKIQKDNEYFSDDALINKSEKIIVDYGVYDDISQLENGKYYKVKKDNKYGIINYKGEVIIPLEYKYINVSMVQNEKEYIFRCEKEDDIYDYINEYGKLIIQSDDIYSISYYNKFNDEYNTLILIRIDGKERYFNLATGEEVLNDEENIKFLYNTQIKNKKVIIFNKDFTVKEEIESTGVTPTMYYSKYMVLLEKTSEESKYIAFDENYNEIFTSDYEIKIIQDENENTYFIVVQNDCVEIYNTKNLITKIDNHTYSNNYSSNSKFIVLRRKNKSGYDVYDFKGNIVVEGISSYRYSGDVLIITRKDDTSSIEYILFDKDKEVVLEKGDKVEGSDYVTLENSSNKTVKVYNMKGNMLMNSITGTKESLKGKYIFIKNDNVRSIYDITTGKKTFEYNTSDYITRDDDFNLIKLKDGYYSFDGTKILDITENE